MTIFFLLYKKREGKRTQDTKKYNGKNQNDTGPFFAGKNKIVS